MPSPLVDTKLYFPSLPSGLVSRPRLIALMDRSRDARLMLLSAPPGFGKTTALAAWLAQRDHDGKAGRAGSVAWLSLEQSERSPASFWTAVLTCLASTVPGVGAGVLPLLQLPQPPVEVVLTTVLNELGGREDDLYLVLDDYHLADGPAIASGMAFLLQHLPPRVHVVISTRSDPDLALARMRARGQLVEVRAADLRFRVDEVAAYLHEAAGLDLDAEHVTVLEERTEGWIAALQLAALSMRGRPEPSAFVDGFAGDDRYIVDYLVEEVLARQSEQVRTFLVRTSILDRLTGPLCDAVTGQAGGRAMLETLERANLFVVPLDDTRRWYRYHHLFADVLQAYLADEGLGLVSDLHRRASRWYDGAGEPFAAVRHALAGGDVERAAELVEAAIPGLQRQRQEATIRRWLDDIPDDVVRTRPVLAVGFIGALMAGNEFDAVPARLAVVERLLALRPAGHVGPWRPPGTLVVDDAELTRLPGAVELYRAALALVHGELAQTHRHASTAIERSAPTDDLTRAGAAALTALAYWSVADLEAAHRGYVSCVEGLRRVGNIGDVLGCTIAMADIRITQGRLSAALKTCQHALELAAHEDGAVRGTADMYVTMAQIALDRGDVGAAVEHVGRSQALGEHLGLPQNPYRWRVVMARVHQLRGDLAGALELLAQAERVYVADFSPPVRPVPAVRARLSAAAGDVAAAWRWAGEHGVDVHDDLTYVREFEHITLARVLLAQHEQDGSAEALHRAGGLLDRLLAAASDGGRVGNVIEILVLLALVRQALDDVPGARTALERSLELAELEGHVTVFAVQGPPMAMLLVDAAARRPRSEYLSRLVAACTTGAPETGAPETGVPETGAPDSVAVDTRAAAGVALVAPLSARELAVLRLLASDLNGPQIARELVVSLNTVRSHTKSIYAKLGVNSRRAAVRQAQDLHLITAHRPG